MTKPPSFDMFASFVEECFECGLEQLTEAFHDYLQRLKEQHAKDGRLPTCFSCVIGDNVTFAFAVRLGRGAAGAGQAYQKLHEEWKEQEPVIQAYYKKET